MGENYVEKSNKWHNRCVENAKQQAYMVNIRIRQKDKELDLAFIRCIKLLFAIIVGYDTLVVSKWHTRDINSSDPWVEVIASVHEPDDSIDSNK